MEFAKQNPILAGLILGGIAWLLWAHREKCVLCRALGLRKDTAADAAKDAS